MKVILQSEATECGLACLCMVMSNFGSATSLSEMRRRYPIGLNGTNLMHLAACASDLKLAVRPLRLHIDELSMLSIPSLLHWDLNHVVVLEKSSAGSITILDPAVGRRKISRAEVSSHFTGVALELTKTSEFKKVAHVSHLRLRELIGHISGLKRSLGQIGLVALALEVFAIIAPLFQQMIVDEVLTAGDRDLLTVLALGFALLLIVQTLVGVARSWMVILLGQTLYLQWTVNVFAHLIRLPVSFFEKRHLGDVTSRFSSIQAIQRTLTTAVVEAILDGVMAIAALIMILIYAPTLAAVTVGAVVLYGLLR